MRILNTTLAIFALCTGLHASAQEEVVSAEENVNVKYVKSLKGTYMNSSCGEDRLGGNKICFINEDIPLKVLSDTLTFYKIALSQQRYGYIPKEMVADTAVEHFSDVAISGSISVRNSGKTDRISIALSERKPYIIREEIEPKRFIIELHGVQNNSNWITQYENLASISYIDAVQCGSDVLRLTLGLKNSSSWGYTVRYEGNNLVVDVKHTPELSLKGMVIGVDAGHGGPDSPGARGVNTKVNEKDLNLDMAFRLKRILEKRGAIVVLSRESDITMTMGERKAKFLENNIDLMVSIHCNAGGNANGTSTYYKQIQYKPLAETILRNIRKLDGVRLFGMVGNFNFSLNAPVEYPNVLVETLFLSDPDDERRLNNPKFRKKIMKRVADGLDEYLKECRK